MKLKSFFLSLSAMMAVLPVMAQPDPDQPSWLSDAVFYQIYPSSFQDSDGNGIGDLPGITSRLEYVRSLGGDCGVAQPYLCVRMDRWRV